MKVLVVGAAGRSGRAIVDAAVAAGHEVTAFVHSPGDRLPTGVTVIQGDATDASDVDGAVAGQDAVIDAVGGKLSLRATTLERTAGAAVVSAMLRHGVRRLVCISMAGEGESGASVPIYERLLLRTLLGREMADKEALEAEVEASGLDFVIVRPGFLGDGAATGSINVIDPASGGKVKAITRADLAEFMVAQLTAGEHVGRAVTVSGA